jgi:cytidylate kinase
MIITIDGPAASGKSTAARLLARELGIAYLDTGATYRAVTLKAMREGADLEDAAALAELARRSEIRLEPHGEAVEVLLDGEDVSREVRRAEVTENAHHVADAPAVRRVLVDLQRRLGAALGSFVAEGRDQGTVVFPDADVKFYLDADPDVRAERRRREMAAAGEPAAQEDVLGAIAQRDRRDSSRQTAPLARPKGAIVVDTSDLDVGEMVAVLRRHVERRS